MARESIDEHTDLPKPSSSVAVKKNLILSQEVELPKEERKSEIDEEENKNHEEINKLND